MIAGMAVSVPKEQVDLMDLGFDAYTMKRIARLTGIHQVRYAPKDKTALDYCIDASRRVIDGTGIDKNEIDGIVFATPHPDYVYPPNVGLVQRALGLPKKCIAMDINHSCTGLIYGIFEADLLVQSGHCKNVLVCCGDTASHHLNKRDRSLRTVVGDGGAAVLVTAGGHLSKYAFMHDGDGFEYLYTPAGGERMALVPGVTDQETMDEEENWHAPQDEYMNGLEVMRFVMNEIPPLARDVLQQEGWEIAAVDAVAFHQANALIVKNLGRALQAPKEKILLHVDGYGNIGGGSVAVALCGLAAGQSERWKKTLLCEFGTGLSGAVMTADFSETWFSDVNLF